jgi:hypothetical protein
MARDGAARVVGGEGEVDGADAGRDDEVRGASPDVVVGSVGALRGRRRVVVGGDDDRVRA